MPTFDQDQIEHLELVAKTTEKAQAFNSVMIAVGYATFFALWANVKGCATPASHMVAGGLLLVSVLLFAGWHVVGMVMLNVSVMSLISLVDPTPGRRPIEALDVSPREKLQLAREALDDPDSGLTTVQKVSLRMAIGALALARWWPYTLAMILLPALIGLAVLLSTYVHGAWLAYGGTVLRCA